MSGRQGMRWSEAKREARIKELRRIKASQHFTAAEEEQRARQCCRLPVLTIQRRPMNDPIFG
jgi:hypothetical protein